MIVELHVSRARSVFTNVNLIMEIVSSTVLVKLVAHMVVETVIRPIVNAMILQIVMSTLSVRKG